MSTVESQIAQRARQHAGSALTNLSQYITYAHLEASFESLNRTSSPGIDGLSWSDYDQDRSARLSSLLSAYKTGSYRAPAVRRVYIPKGKDSTRPLGIPTVADKVLQSGVKRILEPLYETEFRDFSYGFRPGRSCHQAIDHLSQEVSFGGKRHIIDADIRSYFDSIDHGHLRSFLDKRVKDGLIRKQLDKWLKAGILDKGQLRRSEYGTPQGGIISPLLSNIYLHYVLDEWFAEEVRPTLAGDGLLIRYADDFVMCFEQAGDARHVMELLPERFAAYHLELNATKTHLLDLEAGVRGKRSFDFLGFTHYLGKSRKGYKVLKRKTSGARLSRSLSRQNEWLRRNRHQPLKELMGTLNRKLNGHYNYYGIQHNHDRLKQYQHHVRLMLHKWLNRRGGKTSWTWERLDRLLKEWIPMAKPRIKPIRRLSANLL